MDNLGDRIKRYENVYRQYAIRRMPLIIRVDGKAFHTFTRGCRKPFDNEIMSAMDNAAILTAADMQGFKVGYVQSDEVTFLLTDYDTLETDAWFAYNIQKIASISAATMSVRFNSTYNSTYNGHTPAIFDARVFNVPIDDVVNTFLWRAKDWERNSVQMYARAFFSHKELHGKGRADIHEMLHNIGKNWTTDLSGREKNGLFFTLSKDGVNSYTDIKPEYEAIKKIINPLIML